MGIISAFARGTAVLTLILLVVAIVKQSFFVAVAVLFVLIKFAIVIAFIALMACIVTAIFRDRARRKRAVEDL